MRLTARILAMLVAAGALAGCSDLNGMQQRTLSGGAIGAAGGAVVTAITGGPVLLGAAVGAAGGALVGAVTSQPRFHQ